MKNKSIDTKVIKDIIRKKLNKREGKILIMKIQENTNKQLRKKAENKKASGITLIALVITIIVLIILAGVTIAMLTGENGIITKVITAKENTEAARLKEKNDLEELEREILDYTSETPKVKDDKPGELEGEGTAEKPYMINSMEDFVKFSEQVNNGDLFKGKTVKLNISLDMKSDNSYIDPKTTMFDDYNGDGEIKGLKEEITEINKIGFKGIQEFNGTFNGKGNYIRNMGMNIKMLSSGFVPKQEYGLFKNLNGIVEDLKLEGNIQVQNAKNDYEIRIGSIVGDNNGKVLNCTSNVKITFNATNIFQDRKENTLYAGGIVGKNGPDAYIDNCYNYGEIQTLVTSDYANLEGYNVCRVGGIVASNDGTTSNSVNYGNIQLKAEDIGTIKRFKVSAGGVAGKTGAGSKLLNVANIANLKGESTSRLFIGGITGETEDKSETKISAIIRSSYNKGIVEATGVVGGEDRDIRLKIAGIVAESYGSISDCYNTGKIISYPDNAEYKGGIIGDTHGSQVVKNCHYLASTASGGAQNLDDISEITRNETLSDEKVCEELNKKVEENNAQNPDIKWKKWRNAGKITLY